jgi:hypothetical protein
MIAGSIWSILLIFRAILREGSLFPVRYSLTREGETPNFFANSRCDIDSWSNRIFTTSESDGLAISQLNVFCLKISLVNSTIFTKEFVLLDVLGELSA